ncbi:TonB-dependent siderophore receptor [Pseudomonas fluorescens]|nr:TonB-dependent siderophore receptor [Pseudomonas fluorescens]
MHHPLPKGLRVKSLFVTPLTMLCMLISGLAVADPHSFDIAPQPLAGALNRLAAQSGLQVIFDGTLVLASTALGSSVPKNRRPHWLNCCKAAA